MSFWKWVLGLVAFIGMVLLYKNFNPIDIQWFPKCPFYLLTDLQCPGCGSQRAAHHLLNLSLLSALKENSLMVFSIPYIVLGYGIRQIKQPSDQVLQLRKALYGEKAIYVILFLVIAFWVGRNLFEV